MNKMYHIIIFDPNQIEYSASEINRFISKSVLVLDWWNYLKNVYIVETRMSSQQMSDSIVSTYPGLKFFIIKVDIGDHNGVLEKNAWLWFQNKAKISYPMKELPPAKNSELLDIIKRLNPDKD